MYSQHNIKHCINPGRSFGPSQSCCPVVPKSAVCTLYLLQCTTENIVRYIIAVAAADDDNIIAVADDDDIIAFELSRGSG